MNQFNRGHGFMPGPPHVMQGVDMGLQQEVQFLRSRVQSLEMTVQELQKDSCEFRMQIQNLQNELKEVKYQQQQPIKVVLKNPDIANPKDKPSGDGYQKKDRKPGKQGDGAAAAPPSANPDKKNKNKQKKGGGEDVSKNRRDRSIDSHQSECATPKSSGKHSSRKRHDSSNSSSSSCPSDISDCNESVASSLSHEMIGKFDFIWCFNDVKGAWRRAKTQNKKFKEIVSRELCSDQDGYLYRLHLCLCGAAGYFTFDKFICAGLSTSSPSSNSKLRWPVKNLLFWEL